VTVGIGIDLSGTSRGSLGRTVGAALSDRFAVIDIRTIRYGYAGDLELVEWIDRLGPGTVAIDAPLSLPHGVSCVDPRCERCAAGAPGYLSREVDPKVGGMSTVMLAAIAFRGIFLGRQLRRRGHRVIEAYPRAAFEALGLPSSGRPELSILAHGLARVVSNSVVSTRDELDAIVAAVVAVDHSLGRAQVVRGFDGEIWLPANRLSRSQAPSGGTGTDREAQGRPPSSPAIAPDTDARAE
jgi:predicted nuclease with RNAse H fold